MTHPTNGTSVRHYIVQDSSLASSGLGIGAYIKANFTTGGSTLPHHDLLWVGSQIDHDGNTSARSAAFKNLGWDDSPFNFDVFNNEDPIRFQLDANDTFKWIKTGESTWSESTVDYDGSGGSGTGVMPSGWSVYMAYAAKGVGTTATPVSYTHLTLPTKA